MRLQMTKRWSLAAGLLAGALMILADVPVASADPQQRGQTRVQGGSSGSSSGGSSARASSGSSRGSSSGSVSRSSGGRSSARSTPQTRPSRRGDSRPSSRVQSPGNYDGSSSAADYSRRDGERRSYRDHRGRHGYRGHHYRNHSYWGSPHYYPYWGSRYYWGWGPYWWGGYYGPPVRVYYSAADGLGALDFDVRPEKAEVFLNGQRIGVADNFDGFPTYLWLEEGTYDVVIYREGFETIARQYSIVPGVVIDIEDRMTPGEAIHPDDLPASSTVNRDRRAQRNQERRDALEREDEEWRERARTYRERRGEAADSRDARAEPSRLFLSVEPGDASVYLDGRVLGTGDELSRLHAGLLVDAGEHELEVVHPDYEPKTLTFEVDEAGEVTLDVELEPED